MSLTSIVVTVLLVAASAFFVAVEFALVASRRHRLEDAAVTSRSARAALRSARELSLLLAGSQLGITLCVLGLGAISKPALDYALEPVLLDRGLPSGAAGVLAFVLSLAVVTFLHLVVGEMAPKSWAIAHPERAATALALPMRAFMRVTRPLLLVLNGAANWCLRRVGVEPVDEVAAGRNREDLRELVDHSANTGALPAQQRDQLMTALELDRAPLRRLLRPQDAVAAVPAGATAGQVRRAARDSGHLRLLVHSVDDRPVGVVHVRDVLEHPEDARVDDVVRPVLTLDADVPVHQALRTMRTTSNQLALVQHRSGSDVGRYGLLTLHDLLDALLPPPTERPPPPSGQDADEQRQRSSVRIT